MDKYQKALNTLKTAEEKELSRVSINVKNIVSIDYVEE